MLPQYSAIGTGTSEIKFCDFPTDVQNVTLSSLKDALQWIFAHLLTWLDMNVVQTSGNENRWLCELSLSIYSVPIHYIFTCGINIYKYSERMIFVIAMK
jgi:hypothetical protein